MATELTAKEVGCEKERLEHDGFVALGSGGVRYVELDAEKMGGFFTRKPNETRFDCVWISEALSHLPDKGLFFRNAFESLNEGGKLVVADWFRDEGLTDREVEADIKPIEGLVSVFPIKIGCISH